jgi:hypothetical protein
MMVVSSCCFFLGIMPDLSYICYCCYFLGDNDVNFYQLGIDAANLHVVNSYFDEGNTIPAVFSIQGDEDQTSIGHMERSDEDSSTEKSTEKSTDIDTAMSSECSAASSSGSTDFLNSTSDSDSHAQKNKSPAKSKVAKIGRKRTYAFSSTQIG